MFSIKHKAAVLLLILSIPLSATAQTTTSSNTIFNDVNELTPNQDSISTLKTDGTIHGYEDGTFKPGFTINRAEFATIITNSLNLETSGNNCFNDVKDEWFAPAICTLKASGAISGYADGSFQPGRNINLVEASKIIAVANKLPQSEGQNWFEPFIKALQEKNAIPVSIDSLDQKLSRAEVVEMIYRITKNETARTSKTLDSLNKAVPQITSCAELEEKVSDFQYRNNRAYLMDYAIDDEESISDSVSDGIQNLLNDSTAAPEAAEKSTPAGSGSGSSDYSSTNIQVENVDESDVMKNDGSHIYFIQGQNVKIVQAYPANEMKEEANIEPDKNFTPSSLYLNGKNLIILGNSYSDAVYQTSVYIYDISTPSKPEQIRKLQFSGYEVSSRRIDNNLYLVLHKYQPFYYYAPYLKKIAPTDESSLPMNLEESLPGYFDSTTGKSEKLAGCNDIAYFPHYQTVDYLIVAGIPLNDTNKSITRKVMLGGSENVYSSEKNLYVASTSYEYPEYSIYDSWENTPKQYSYDSTNIYRFALNNGSVEFKERGKVSGHLINQFSMDESSDSFRIATTSNGTKTTNNNLYVLNKNNVGETLGKIEGIAPGEVIYSTRFIGNKAYMVTFKTTDPLFVIDLNDSKNPKIVGKLKIPGYSNYLHPYDENHLIGLGKEAVEDKSGNFAWYQGVKLALFDVSDVSNPKELSTVTIGDRGTESEALQNHRAILFSKEKGFIAFPVTIAQKNDSEKEASAYGEFIFQGAQVYNINTTDGITLRGAITHYAENAEEYLKASSYWWPQSKDIKRILYIGSNFYTVSDGMIKATNMDSMKEQNKIELEVKNQNYYNDYLY